MKKWYRRIAAFMAVLLVAAELPLYANAGTLLFAEELTHKNLTEVDGVLGEAITGDAVPDEGDAPAFEYEEIPEAYTANEVLGEGETVEPLSESLSEQLLGASATTLPAKYDGRKKGYMPPVKHQGSLGTCWAHSIIACAEIQAIKKGLYSRNEIDLSEAALAYFATNTNKAVDPLGLVTGDRSYRLNEERKLIPFHEGNSVGKVTLQMTGWMGLVREDNASAYSKLLKQKAKFTLNSIYGFGLYRKKPGTKAAEGRNVLAVRDVYYLNTNDRNNIKQMIMKYGGVSMSFLVRGNKKIGNASCKITEGPYKGDVTIFNVDGNPTISDSSHAVTIIGWDDNYPRNLFNGGKAGKMPKKNGAWIFRNSWGEKVGNGGYYMISYEDPTMCSFTAYNAINTSAVTKQQKKEAIKYHHNYHYDGSGSSVYRNVGLNQRVANVFTIKEPYEKLKAVSIASYTPGVTYKVEIYKATTRTKGKLLTLDKKLAVTKFTFGYAGVETVDLPSNQQQVVKKNTTLAVVVTPIGFPKGTQKQISQIMADQTRTLKYRSGNTHTYIHSAKRGVSFQESSKVWTDIANVKKGQYGSNWCIKLFTTSATPKTSTLKSSEGTGLSLRSGSTGLKGSSGTAAANKGEADEDTAERVAGAAEPDESAVMLGEGNTEEDDDVLTDDVIMEDDDITEDDYDYFTEDDYFSEEDDDITEEDYESVMEADYYYDEGYQDGDLVFTDSNFDLDAYLEDLKNGTLEIIDVDPETGEIMDSEETDVPEDKDESGDDEGEEEIDPIIIDEDSEVIVEKGEEIELFCDISDFYEFNEDTGEEEAVYEEYRWEKIDEKPEEEEAEEETEEEAEEESEAETEEETEEETQKELKEQQAQKPEAGEKPAQKLDASVKLAEESAQKLNASGKTAGTGKVVLEYKTASWSNADYTASSTWEAKNNGTVTVVLKGKRAGESEYELIEDSEYYVTVNSEKGDPEKDIIGMNGDFYEYLYVDETYDIEMPADADSKAEDFIFKLEYSYQEDGKTITIPEDERGEVSFSAVEIIDYDVETDDGTVKEYSAAVGIMGTKIGTMIIRCYEKGELVGEMLLEVKKDYNRNVTDMIHPGSATLKVGQSITLTPDVDALEIPENSEEDEDEDTYGFYWYTDDPDAVSLEWKYPEGSEEDDYSVILTALKEGEATVGFALYSYYYWEDEQDWEIPVTVTSSGGGSGGGDNGGSSGSAIPVETPEAAITPIIALADGSQVQGTSVISVPVAKLSAKDKESYVGSGKWTKDAYGRWSLENEKGEMLKGCWALVSDSLSSNSVGNASWYYFDANGKMLTGWQWILSEDGKRYCYYFNKEAGSMYGACLMGGTTKDGYLLNAKGRWVDVSGKEQTK